MKKKNIILIIISVVILIALIILGIFSVICFKNTGGTNDVISTEGEVVTFKYHSGNGSFGIDLVGITDNAFGGFEDEEPYIINIDIQRFEAGDTYEYGVSIPFEDFENIYKSTKEEDCKKQTSEYQCGDALAVGCEVKSFSISFGNNKVCYEGNEEVSSFFENLANYSSETSYNLLNREEKDEINLKDLLEDIASIKEGSGNSNALNARGGIFGEGYTISKTEDGNKITYTINSSNDTEIWSYKSEKGE